jgi:hypothetical protein
MRLIGLLILVAVLAFMYRSLPGSTSPTGPTSSAPAQPVFPEIVPEREIPQIRAGETSSSGSCRSTANGKLENNPTFGGSDLVQVDYWTPGQPERSVLLPGGMWSHPSDMGGTFWVWVGCTFDEARQQVELAISRRLNDGANQDGWGNPGLFSPAS